MVFSKNLHNTHKLDLIDTFFESMDNDKEKYANFMDGLIEIEEETGDSFFLPIIKELVSYLLEGGQYLLNYEGNLTRIESDYSKGKLGENEFFIDNSEYISGVSDDEPLGIILDYLRINHIEKYVNILLSIETKEGVIYIKSNSRFLEAIRRSLYIVPKKVREEVDVELAVRRKYTRKNGVNNEKIANNSEINIDSVTQEEEGDDLGLELDPEFDDSTISLFDLENDEAFDEQI